MKRFSLRLFLMLVCVSIAAPISPVNAQTPSSSALEVGITFSIGTTSKTDAPVLVDPVKGFTDSLTVGSYSASVSVSLRAPNHWRSRGAGHSVRATLEVCDSNSCPDGMITDFEPAGRSSALAG